MQHAGNNFNIKVNDIIVRYNDEGPKEASVIIFIHGFPLNKSMWDKQLKSLKDDYRVIAYDIRGHGNTDVGAIDFSIDLFVNDLLGFMDALKIEKTIICGLSMGGYIALNAIENHSDRFTALILSDTNCTADSPEAIEKRMNTIISIKENGVEKLANNLLPNLFAPESFETNSEEIAAVKEMIVTTSKQSLYNSLHALANRNETCSKLSGIKVPVLILVGEEDKITPIEAARAMNVKIRNANLHIIPHSGHLSNLENPYEFNSQLTKFMATVKPI
ncbi:MAG: alpha/beta fold hydrolase [Flavobacteriaceae bacterium]|nr:alpha/beta fold hydrolase [Flavobacteriaceae bacterium]